MPRRVHDPRNVHRTFEPSQKKNEPWEDFTCFQCATTKRDSPIAQILNPFFLRRPTHQYLPAFDLPDPGSSSSFPGDPPADSVVAVAAAAVETETETDSDETAPVSEHHHRFPSLARIPLVATVIRSRRRG